MVRLSQDPFSLLGYLALFLLGVFLHNHVPISQSSSEAIVHKILLQLSSPAYHRRNRNIHTPFDTLPFDTLPLEDVILSIAMHS